ncbi:MAG: SH3 domain-containing protein [Syntrophales bacterium]
MASACVLFVCIACGGGSAVKSEPAAAKEPTAASPGEGPKEAPLGRKYDRVVFQKFVYDAQIETDYPGAVAECEKSAREAVIAKKVFASAAQAAPNTPSAGALLVKAKVTSLRIVSTGARMWGGAFAGSSEMSLRITLVDASSGTVVREKDLSTNNNPWAASWTGGSSDRSLPADLGMMVAEYLAAIQPQRQKSATAVSAPAEERMTEVSSPKQAGEVKEQAKPIQPPREVSPPAAPAAKILLITKPASVRSAPTTKSKILTTLKKGATVEYLGKSGNWFNVKLSTGVVGWVFNSLVREQK